MKFKRMFENLKKVIVSVPDIDSRTFFKILDILNQCLSTKETKKYNVLINDLRKYKDVQQSLDKFITKNKINNLNNRLILLRKTIN